MNVHNEIVIGITCPIGVETKKIVTLIEELFSSSGFNVHKICISSILEDIAINSTKVPNLKIKRFQMLQDLGDFLRIKSKKPEILMLIAIEKIRSLRKENKNNVYIIKSFKHPDEVNLMKHIYKENFFLLGAFCDDKDKILNINNKFQIFDIDQVNKVISNDHHRKIENNQFFHLNCLKNLIKRKKFHDYKDLSKLTQKTKATLYLSDVIVNVSKENEAIWIIKRFFNLLMANPFETPTLDEMCMFFAKSYSLRSSSPNRHVGACIATDDGKIISLGCNEVAKIGGGHIWNSHTKSYDNRDLSFFKGKSIDYMCDKYINDSINQIEENGWKIQHKNNNCRESLIKSFRQTPLISACMFRNRDCHAEMSALLDASCRGVSTKNCILFTTTFPCHNCTKHIICAGIKKVIYIQPYSKSESFNLWPTDISNYEDENKVPFMIFTGISPNIFSSFFSPVTKRKKIDEFGRYFFVDWTPSVLRTRISKWAQVCPIIRHKQSEDVVLKSLPNKLLKRIKSVII